MQNEVKSVLLDLDNTLTDFMKVKRDCVKASVKAMLGAGLQENEVDATRLLWQVYYQHGLENQFVFQKFLKKISPKKKINFKTLAAGILAYKRAKEGKVTPYPEVKPTLSFLKNKGLVLGIVTDAPSVQAWTRLFLLGLENAFDFVIAFEDTKKQKPHQAPFQAALTKLCLLPQQVLFVGDNLERDIAGAKKIGFKTAWAKYGSTKTREQNKDRKPDYVLNSFSDLKKIL